MMSEFEPVHEQRDVPREHRDSTQRAWQVFIRLAARKGLRMTQARRIVFDEVFARHDHFTADQLASDLATGRRRVSRSTVYATLKLLVEAELVSEAYDRQGRTCYEHSYGHSPHEHMVCVECGAVLEFSDETLRRQIAENCREAGFVAQSYNLTVFGTCREFAAGSPDACPHYRRHRAS